MRMWSVPPQVLCQQHLLGEHVEMHMFVGTLRKGISIRGYIERGQVDPPRIFRRHEELVAEMVSRGMNHQSPLFRLRSRYPVSIVDSDANLVELARRCSKCAERQKEYGL